MPDTSDPPSFPRLSRVVKGIRFVWVMVGLTILAVYVADRTAGCVLPSGMEIARDLSLYEGEGRAIAAQQLAVTFNRRESSPLGWRILPMPKQDLVNVTDEGFRVVVGPTPASDAKTLWLFGGSTMWGWDARDEETIGSQIAQLLGPSWRVENYSEVGFASVQELLLLQRLLLKKPKPDAVVFLDGLNDIETALIAYSMASEQRDTIPADEYTGQTFEIQWLQRPLLNRSEPPGPLAKFLRAKSHVLAYLREKQKLAFQMPAVEPAQVKPLAKAIGERQRMHVNTVAGLCGRLGIESLLYWQPLALTKKALSDHEKRLVKENVDGFLMNQAELVAAAHAQVRRLLADEEHFRDISGMFDDVSETVYTDFRHYTPTHQKQLAERIAADIELLQEQAVEPMPNDETAAPELTDSIPVDDKNGSASGAE